MMFCRNCGKEIPNGINFAIIVVQHKIIALHKIRNRFTRRMSRNIQQ